MSCSRFGYVTYIRTTPQQLWRALMEPEFTRRYWVETWQESEWKAGAAWRIVIPDGRIGDSGQVLEIDPYRRLVLSWRVEFKPELRAEGFSRLTYELEPRRLQAQRARPRKRCRGHARVIQAEAGFLSITGTANEPAKAGCSIADIAAGIYAYCGILAALIQRGRTGRGDHIEISMLESLVEWMSQALYYAFDGARAAPRTGAAHATIYPYGPFPTAGNGTVLFGLQNEREWAVFCDRVLQRPALATDARFSSNAGRVDGRAELRAIIVEAFSGLTAQQVVRRLDDAQIANARVNTVREVWDHAQLSARGRWVEIETPVGKIPAPLPPGLPQACLARMGAVPAVGEHTRAILAEIGFDAPAIARLRAEHAI